MPSSAWSVPPVSLPEARSNHASFIWNDRLYILGGLLDDSGAVLLSGDVKSALLDNKGSLGPWRVEQSLMDDVYDIACLVSPDNILYVSGGRGAENNITTVRYAQLSGDGKMGIWKTAAALPQALAGHKMCMYDNVLYVVGGANEATPVVNCYMARVNSDGSLQPWVATTPLPVARAHHALGERDGYIYVIGGIQDSELAESTAIYSAYVQPGGGLGTWKTVGATTVSRTNQASAKSDDVVYMVGGLASGEVDTLGSTFTTFTNSSDQVTGIEGLFSEQLGVGDLVRPVGTGVWYLIASIEDDDNLTLATAYLGPTATDVQLEYMAAGAAADMTGTQATFTNASATVQGAGTAFDTDVAAGDVVKPTASAVWYDVDTVTDADTLVLGAVFPASTVTSGMQVMAGSAPAAITGTSVTFTNNSDQVTGDGTNFDGQIVAGDLVRPDATSVWYVVESVEDDTNLTLTAVYGGVTAAAVDGELMASGAVTDAAGNPSLTFTQDSDEVTGVRTNFGSETDTIVGALIRPAAQADIWYTIESIADTETLTLTANFAQATVTSGADKKAATTITTLAGARGEFEQDSDTVAGEGTTFDEDITVGDLIRPQGTEDWYQVASIEDAENLTLTTSYRGSTVLADIEVQVPSQLSSVDAVKLDPSGQVGRIAASGGLPAARRGAACAAANGIIYMTGGMNSSAAPVATINVAGADASGALTGLAFGGQTPLTPEGL